MAIAPDIAEAIAHYQTQLEKLRDHGLPPFGAPGYMAAFMASRDARAQKHAQEQVVWQQIDRELLPSLLQAYQDGTADERGEIRTLLASNRIFAWGLGWAGRDKPPRPDDVVTEDTLRRRLLLFAMKDGVPDWRDEIMSLDSICAGAGRAGIAIGPLLSWAAGLAGDAPRGSRPSTREVLLARCPATHSGS